MVSTSKHYNVYVLDHNDELMIQFMVRYAIYTVLYWKPKRMTPFFWTENERL